MANGKDIVELARTRIGDKYHLGSIAPKDYSDYHGPWDCAEFTSWLVYQLTGKLYGCALNEGNPRGADAYSGFWYRDAKKLGVLIPVDEATTIPGAFVLRVSGPDLIGHIVVSQGNGRTIEAHSKKHGVISSSLQNRRWTTGILVPFIEYEPADISQPVITPPAMVYRWKNPMMQGPVVKAIQTALRVRADGYFGPKTFNAVRAFQESENLVADGEVGPITAARLGIRF